MSRTYLARALAERGVFDEGDGHGQEAVRIAEALDHPFSLVWACLGLAYLNSARGELGQAARLLERAVSQSHDWNIMFYAPVAMASLGHVHACSGRIAEGVSSLEQALTAYESSGIGYFHSLSVVQLGEAYLRAGQVMEARACADRALMLARKRGERGHEAWALRLLGEVASHPDHPDIKMAEAHYGAAMALASELGMRPLLAHCHMGLSRLYKRTVKGDKVQEHLTVASKMFRQMGMRFWLEKAEAEMKELPDSQRLQSIGGPGI
jgi:tetratricopeptide (TPR) repeat protein